MKKNTLIRNIQQWLHLKSKASKALKISMEDRASPSIPTEIFSADQMARYGATLAFSHTLTQKPAPDSLLERLSSSEALLIKSCDILTKKTHENDGFSPAREWLLDNFYLIQEQIYAIRRHLSKGYGRSLPQLASSVRGYPRIYDIALEIIEHSDGRWDLENLNSFVAAYQSVTSLTVGELWAMPITLGVALIENLSNASKRIVADRNDRKLAGFWADRLLEVALSDPKKLVIVIADMAHSEPTMRSAYVAELARRLHGAALALPMSWIEQHLAEEGLTIETLVQAENKHQAAIQVTVSNSIAGLRHLTEVDWRNFVEKMSVVEKTLRLDPSATYSLMDFGTRDRYRHVIERLARTCAQSEQVVAETAIQLAKIKSNSIITPNKHIDPDNARYCHVGFYLVDNGLSQLEKVLGIRFSFWQKLCRFINKWRLASYLGCIGFITMGLTITLLYKAHLSGITHVAFLLLGLALALCSSQLAIALVNLGATLRVKPRPLPKMDFTKGIPTSFSTLVVVPAMLDSAEGIESLVEALEVRFLGNREQNLYFALLTDFNDAPEEHLPEDSALLNLAQEQIAALNKRYAQKYGQVFFLFHRERQWNASEQVWMGKERKRGKLIDLNNLLRGVTTENFSLIVGDLADLNNIKYVITLDTDTQLPRESARQFVGTMAHPLNRPRFDTTRQIVVEGYGILQPRVAEVLSTTEISRYVQLCGNEFGIDPYTRTVSDVYQDMFHEGSYIGKGIYDVDLFQQVLKDRFPDNRILSHDLLEGCYLRSGFLSDVPLYEKSTHCYLADAKRRTRWIRGDWQLAGWLLPSVLNGSGSHVINPLSFLSKLKLFDNLRRSLVSVALMLFLALNWTILPANYFWLSLILAMMVLPAGINTFLEFLHKPNDVLPSQHIANMIQIARKRAGQFVLYLACLPHEAEYSLVAILCTSWRMLVSKRHLLEWTPFDQIDQRLCYTSLKWFARMWMGPTAAFAAVGILVTNGRFGSLLLASPLFLLWLTSPLIAHWLSQPIQIIAPKIDSTQIRFLHIMARKTWGFFENFMTAEDHWLPPDNYQEAPIEALARRTSPTNIGLSLLANLTAYDFGYISIDQLLERINNTLQTMTMLEGYRGHLYNWYSTETLAPLLPRYISTVDSGNLAGHLLTLRQGLLALPNDTLLDTRYLDGLEDTWDVLITTVIGPQLLPLQHFRQVLTDARLSFIDWVKALNACNELCLAAEKNVVLTAEPDGKMNETSEWANKLLLQCHTLRDKIKFFASVPELAADITLRGLAGLSSTDAITNAAQSKASTRAKALITLIDKLAAQAFSLAQMDMRFLLDETSHLMTIGFNVDKQKADPGSYDLLSSEARLGNFVAIAQGQAQQESWFALGRLLVSSGRERILVSWSGSMFEFLMPLLVMPTYPGTLLDQTYHGAVKQQIAYGKQRGVPWGVSESGFNAVDTNFNYLYRAFGVPGLGLKRGLEEDLVIAPYASAMALMIAPEAACLNLQRLHTELATGKFGFYEAIDFTLSRLPPDSKKEIVRSFMVHHQGMSLLAFSYLLHNQPMQKRFEADPLFQATLLLLQERIPKPTASYLKIPKSQNPSVVSSRVETTTRIFNNPNTRTPQVQLLSNGHYHLVITQAGGSYSRWKDIAVTRWHEDSTCDNWGMFSFVRDVEAGEFFSTTYQPTRGVEESFKCVFSEAHAEFNHTGKRLDMLTEIVVSPEDDIELRRLRVHNLTKNRRTIEFTSYGEIVLAPQAADLAQPVFSNLFVKTEILKKKQAILVTRRPQGEQQSSPWLCHLLNVYSEAPYTISLSFETDRARFIGRGLSLAEPLAMKAAGDLSNTEGAVLDPIVAIRCRLTLEPNSYAIFDLITGVTETREQCEVLIEKYQDRRLANRIFALSWTHGQVLLHQLNISETDAQLYARLASALIYTDNSRRADPHILANNRRGQSGLWSYSISGDLPIVLLYIENAANIALVQHLLQAQAYWRRKGLVVDLVILNEEHAGYRQTLQDQIMSLITTTTTTDHASNIVVRIAEQVSLEDAILLQSVARIIFSDKHGSLQEQWDRRRVYPPIMPALPLNKSSHNFVNQKLAPLPQDLQFFNGFGGFTATGDEYIIRLAERPTPAPWANVLANPNFGTLVSESGQSYTWAENAHEFRLTPWENDPIKDSAGEAFYLRDEETGRVWSPTALPCRGHGDYQTRHGFGYSVFEHVEDGVYSELWMTVALDAPVKFVVLKIRNDSEHPRRLSATGYVTWVLGDLRHKNAIHVITELSKNGALLAQNHYNTEFSGRTAFFDAATNSLDLNARTFTGDRAEFIGRNRTERQPMALEHKHLSGRVGAGLDPCAAIQLAFNLASGQSRNIVFTLGLGQDKEEAIALAERYHNTVAFEAVLASVREYWQKTCNAMRVETPDPGLNLLANGWLIYQMLSSRLWGRTGYYQSGGAFGFRDQLQDVMALTHVAPELFRAHLLLCATRQFEVGDVQHWWHPPQNRGVRTRCSDDFLWLPFAVCHYIETTGDKAVLDEAIPFLQGRPLKTEEESYYDLSIMGSEAISLYQHAVRAIINGLKFGKHGLPLIGSGDWNDGMNLVGKEGRGESVWLGFFLYKVLKDFAPLASRYGDHAFALRCETESLQLQRQIENQGWDGEWYRRAYFDNGAPLGSASNSECRIDSIAQSWAVLSGAADPERSKKALAALYSHLVKPTDGLIKLLDPPFDISMPNPGYIEGYVPGIRENGGQYTHAAIWAAMAFAKLDEKQIAWQLFDMLNPINHGRTPAEIKRYKIEPYVVAADVYSVEPHIGRGGWSWYTGSASWLYRLITETLLGIRLEGGNQLRLAPILPDHWDGFTVDYQYGSTNYKIMVKRTSDKGSIWVDGVAMAENVILLIDDRKTHQIYLHII